MNNKKKSPDVRAETYLNGRFYQYAEKYCNIQRKDLVLSERDILNIKELFRYCFNNKNQTDIVLESSLRILPGIIFFNKNYENLVDILKASRKIGKAVSLEKLLLLYGTDAGQKKFEEYCKKQAISNSFEYKQQKYGWTLEEFNRFNKSRAITKNNLIKKHGKKEGMFIWENYKKRQAFTCTKEYFIQEYGEENGKQKFLNFQKKRYEQIEKNLSKRISFNKSGIYSNISYIFFKELDLILRQIGFSDNLYGDNEYGKFSQECGRGFKIDFYNKNTKKAIEFYGDFFHANPMFYENNEVFGPEPSINCGKKRELDDIRCKLIIKFLDVSDILIIWENDVKEDRLDVIEKCINFIKGV